MSFGGRHAAASKVFSLLNLTLINKNLWSEHTKKIEQQAKIILKMELNRAAPNGKEFKFSSGHIEPARSYEELNVIKASVTKPKQQMMMDKGN